VTGIEQAPPSRPVAVALRRLTDRLEMAAASVAVEQGFLVLATLDLPDGRSRRPPPSS